MSHEALLILPAYLLGSFPSAVIVSRLFGLQDPRTFGSGNPGATNMLRTGSKFASLLTLVLDIGKGYLAIWLAKRLAVSDPVVTQAMAGIAVMIGHLWSVFMRFRGGKGVATGAGVLLALQLWVGVAVVAVWLLVAALSRYSSLASVCAAISAPLWSLLWLQSPVARIAVVIMSILILYRSKDNLVRLWQRREPKIGAR